ncbi:terpenoid cyclases/protein prenyltransferase alpha-alpha toroid [Massariosphaeria phaeospora]|uniref:Terpenoid cyclases/protein prenyltransferase alpha-alpha toroid n=1 Tax=Massariosphaeria phaeospora TaxID=100035 RepID=A0A7C8IA55_9PLEO|nr:terpenoid cyclases/protein prenyltransferase alpha-alpha toroid [Massariosphaeria phaeospora]
MPVRVSLRARHRNMRMKKMAAPKSSSAEAPSAEALSSRLEELPVGSDRIEELSDTENEYEDIGTITQAEQAHIDYLESVTIPIRDEPETESSKAQREAFEDIRPFLEGNPNDFPLNIFGLPKLQREKHAAFLKSALGDYPSKFAPMDAARPWLLYWSLQGLTALGCDISEYREQVTHTFSMAAYPTGGYGGGYGQYPHLAATYAAVLSLTIVGGTDAYESINRRAMWHFLGQMKQPDGGFTMAPGGEEDIRGAYCGLVVLSLLNLPLSLPPDAPARKHGLTTFLDKLGAWVSSCQTFEGGLSAAPGNEAHGAYAFCGLACLSIMGPPKATLPKHIDLPRLIHWMSYRQCAPEGGYNGRTNKLVDGCYSHWIGGCWALAEAATGRALWNRPALGRYILAAAQFEDGGLVDKPGKRPDGYHSCYNIAGLSHVQHNYVYDEAESGAGSVLLDAPWRWKTQGRYQGDVLWGEDDVVGQVHPIFVTPWGAAEECRKYFEAKEGF